MKLRTLLMLQALYPVMGGGYLVVRYLQLRSGIVQLSASPLWAIPIFLVYAACLLLGVRRKELPYRITMAAAIPICATDGVLINILTYAHTGTASYGSTAVWAVGVAIHSYGLILNVLAAIGAYRR